jgi:polyisoprenoid-binding protein YceI
MLTAPLYAQTGSWSVDSNHSDAQLSINAAINKTNQTIVLGSARVSGTLNLDKSDPTQSSFAFAIYPASSSSTFSLVSVTVSIRTILDAVDMKLRERFTLDILE